MSRFFFAASLFSSTAKAASAFIAGQAVRWNLSSKTDLRSEAAPRTRRTAKTQANKNAEAVAIFANVPPNKAKSPNTTHTRTIYDGFNSERPVYLSQVMLKLELIEKVHTLLIDRIAPREQGQNEDNYTSRSKQDQESQAEQDRDGLPSCFG